MPVSPTQLPHPLAGPQPSPAEEIVEPRETELQVAAHRLGLRTPGDEEGLVSEQEFITQLENMNVDVENPDVVALLSLQSWPMPADQATSWVQTIALNPDLQIQPLVTPYSQALAASGFGPGIAGTYRQFEGVSPFGGLYGPPPAPIGPTAPVTGPEIQVETQWYRYSNGTLVDTAQGVVYYPNAPVPGNLLWINEVVANWSPEQVATWRSRLVEKGYLPKQYEKVEGVDPIFEEALMAFHEQRYLHKGNVPDMSESLRPTMTAKDFQTQISNNVRQQFMAVFGDEPSDAELESWTRFTVQQAVQLQREYMRRGVDESTALSAARVEAGEMATERLWNQPLAEYRREQDENTAFRDAMQRALSALEGL